MVANWSRGSICRSSAISAGGGLSIPVPQHGERVASTPPTTSRPVGRGPPPGNRGRRAATRCTWRSNRAASWSPNRACCSHEVRATKSMGGNFFALVDAGFNDLMRPSPVRQPPRHQRCWRRTTRPAPRCDPTVVAGPLVRIGRRVHPGRRRRGADPRTARRREVGDLMAFHDAGAYGASHVEQLQQPPADRRGAGRWRPAPG